MRRGRVPEHWRRALRHCLGVGLPAMVGYSTTVVSADLAQTCQWAAIVVCSITMPVIGQVRGAGRRPLRCAASAPALALRRRLQLPARGGAAGAVHAAPAGLGLPCISQSTVHSALLSAPRV